MIFQAAVTHNDFKKIKNIARSFAIFKQAYQLNQ